MKRFLYFILILIVAGVSSCKSTDNATKQAQKAMNHRVDSLRAIASAAAIANHDFVLAADQIIFKHGGTESVSPTVNFVMLQGETGTFQLSSPNYGPGFNGIGGVTLQGLARNIRFTESKKETCITFSISDKGLSADVVVHLPKGKYKGSANVDASFATAGLSMYGEVAPASTPIVVKGEKL